MQMLANRYLLNGRARKALQLYQQALADNPAQPALQCRLVLAKLELDRIDEAAAFVLEVLDSEGPEGLRALQAGCDGFVPSDVPADHCALQGLRALLAGDLARARSLFSEEDAQRYPQVMAVARRLED